MADPRDRVTLRPLEPPDADVIAAWAQDPGLCSEADWTAGSSFDDYRRFHRGLIESPPAELLRLGAVCGGALVGYVDLHDAEPDRRERGFLIGGRELGVGASPFRRRRPGPARPGRSRCMIVCDGDSGHWRRR